jgi:hypothetical protein
VLQRQILGTRAKPAGRGHAHELAAAIAANRGAQMPVDAERCEQIVERRIVRAGT